MKIQEAKDMQEAVDKASRELNALILQAHEMGLTVQLETGESSRIGANGVVGFIVTKCWVKPSLLEV